MAGTPVAALIVRVAADLAELKAGVGEINNTLGSMSSTLGTVGKMIAGAFTLSAITSFVGGLIAAASEIDDLSAQTGIAVGTLQELQFAFIGTGVSVQQIAPAIAQLSKRLIEGDTSAVGALKQLNLSAERLIQLSPDQAFLQIAAAIKEVPNPMQQSALAMEIFGKSGAQLLPVLRSNLEELMKAARETGAVMRDEAVAGAEKFDIALERLIQRTKAATANTLEYLTTHNVFAKAIGDVSSLARFVSSGNAMEDVLNRIKSPLNAIANDGLPDLTMSMKEADKVAKLLTDEALKNMKKAQDEHAASVDKASAAYRQYVNFVEERYIQTVATQLALSEQMRQDLFRTETAFINGVQVMADIAAQEQAILDQKEANWRQYMNDIGILMMEQDAREMASTAAKISMWDAFREAIGLTQETFKAFTQAHKVGSEAQMTAAEAMATGVSQIFGELGKKYKAFAIAEAIISTYISVARSLASAPWPFNLVLAAGALAVGLANVAKIRSSEEPGFRTGTHGEYVNFGAGTQVTLHGRERVMTEAEGKAESGMWGAMVAEQRRLGDKLERFIEGQERAIRDNMLIGMGRTA